MKSSRVRPLSKYEIKAGWDIPAVLEQALNSDLPGEIRALVRENVYDTASGNYLLIPQGSRLVGIYDSRIAYASGRRHGRLESCDFPGWLLDRSRRNGRTGRTRPRRPSSRC